MSGLGGDSVHPQISLNASQVSCNVFPLFPSSETPPVELCEFRPPVRRAFALDLMKDLFASAQTYFAHSLSGRLIPSVQVRTPL
jgi:hypothetical protein